MHSIASPRGGGGVLYIFWVRGRAIGKGIDFHDFGIRNGIDFHDFGIRNGINFRNFHNWYNVGYASSEHWYKVGYVFETSMARPRPKSGQVPPPPGLLASSAGGLAYWINLIGFHVKNFFRVFVLFGTELPWILPFFFFAKVLES